MRFPTVFFIAVASLLLLGSNLAVNGTRAPAKKAGVPGEGTCADAGCHNTFALNSGIGSVSIEAPSEFAASTPVDIDITVTDPDAVRYGFEVTVKDDSNGDVGSFELVATNTVKTIGNAQYVTHFLAGSNRTWTVRWIPPADVAQSNVTIYAAGNGADGKSNRDNDRIYTTTHFMEFVPSLDIEDLPVPNDQLSLETIYPNPTGGTITVNVSTRRATVVDIEVYDLSGSVRFVESLGWVNANKQADLDLTELPSGQYVIRANSERGWVTKPLVVLR